MVGSAAPQPISRTDLLMNTTSSGLESTKLHKSIAPSHTF
uniref:Uncharacterized protein n=1 Tax=Ascaris lumbricoides TaxID=6252 RepID=A0A0M3HGB5_ASCLU